MGSQVAVPQAKPGIWIEKSKPFQEREAFCTQSPASIIISSARQIIENRVNIGANDQAEQLDIISDITNIGKFGGIITSIQATSQPGPPPYRRRVRKS
jgi:hypothetical protein